MNFDKFLSYDSIYFKIIEFISIIIMIIGISLMDKIPYFKILFMVGLGILVIAFIISKIISASINKEVSKYGTKKLIEEMRAENSVLFEKRIYVTEHFVICRDRRPYITEIKDITELKYSLSRGSFVYATLNNGKKVPVAKVSDEKSASKLISLVKDRNRNIL